MGAMMKDEEKIAVPKRVACLRTVVGVGLGLALGALAGIIAGLAVGVGIAMALGVL